MRSMSDKRQRKWTRAREGRGFTLAETLMVVAILAVLMAVAFIGLIRWRKVLRQAEYDTAAREICIAAQNHLALAESQGLLDKVTQASSTLKPGLPEGESGDTYYFVHSTGLAATNENNPNNKQSVLALMLPFGAIDENIRGGGSYLIRYQPSTATVIEAFYTEDAPLTAAYHDTLLSLRGDDKKSARRDVQLGDGGSSIIVGYYRNADSGTPTTRLQAPIVNVINGDKLTVEVINPTYNEPYIDVSAGNLKLMVEELPISGTGESVFKEYLPLKDADSPLSPQSVGTVYTVTLDDVTAPEGAFQIATQPNPATTEWVAPTGAASTFTPGCNLKIYAVLTSTKIATAPAVQSAEVITNSLFAAAAPDATDPEALNIEIASYRHLANLTDAVSGFTAQGFSASNGMPVNFAGVKATQTTDLAWGSFKEAMQGDDTVIYSQNPSVVPNSAKGHFLPVRLNSGYVLVYDGATVENAGTTEERVAHHKLSGIEVEASGSAGIFAQLSGNGSTIKNLEVVNATVAATGTGASAGALVGTLTENATISNVLVRSSLSKATDTSKLVTSSGTAGGLVGTVSSGAKVQASAAAIYVNASGAAGGLVGTATSGASLANSYSGGHTTGSADGMGLIAYPTDTMDVTSTGAAAGGLVGSLSASTVTGCYSTCSAKGQTVGGLAGSSSNSTIQNCYVTGLVTGEANTTGAFLGSLTGTTPASGNHYYQIVNGSERMGIGGTTEDTTVTPFDQMDDDGALTTFNSIATGGSDSLAIPYNRQLALRYNGLFAFKTIAEVMADANGGTAVDLTSDDPNALTAHLTRHYGDWPSYEVMVINQQ